MSIAKATTIPSFESNSDEQGIKEILTAELLVAQDKHDQAIEIYKKLLNDKKNNKKELLSRIIELYAQEKRLGDAVGYAEQWLQLEPLNNQVVEVLSYAYFENKEFDKAAAMFNTLVIWLETKEENGYGYIFQILSSEYDPKDAVSIYEKLDVLNEESLQPLLIAARLSFENKMFEDALELTQKALLKAPKIQALYVNAALKEKRVEASEKNSDLLKRKEQSFYDDLANLIVLHTQILWRQDQTNEALNFLVEQTKKYPDNKLLKYTYAQFLIQDYQLQDAKQYLLEQVKANNYLTAAPKITNDDQRERQKELNEKTSWIRLLIDVAIYTNDNALAIELLEALNVISPNQDAFNFDLAKLAFRSEKYDLAVQALNKIHHPNFAQIVQLQRAEIFIAQKQLKEANTIFERLRSNSENDKDKLQLFLQQNALLTRHQYYQEAFSQASYLLSMYSDDDQVANTYAMSALSAGNFSLFEKFMRRMIQLKPDNADALNSLGYSILETNATERYQEACELIEKAYNLNSEALSIRDSLGWCYLKTNRLDLAEKHIKHVYNQLKDPELIVHYVELLRHKQLFNEARSILKNALLMHPKDKYLLDYTEKHKEAFNLS